MSDQAAFAQAAKKAITKKPAAKKEVASLKEALGINRPRYTFRNHVGEEITVLLRKPGLIEVAELMDAYEPLAANMNVSSRHLNAFLDVFFGFVIDQADHELTRDDCARFFRQTSGDDFGAYLHMFMTGVPFDPKG